MGSAAAFPGISAYACISWEMWLPQPLPRPPHTQTCVGAYTLGGIALTHVVIGLCGNVYTLGGIALAHVDIRCQSVTRGGGKALLNFGDNNYMR